MQTLRKIKNAIETSSFLSGLFDYVSAISLLEHLEDDKRAINSISDITKRNGYLYVCVSTNTYKRMWPFLWPIYFYLDKKIGHKRHYSIESLNKKMKEEDFNLKGMFYNGHLGDYFDYFSKSYDSLMKKPGGSLRRKILTKTQWVFN